MGIKNKNMILITGASKGIGKFLFDQYHQAGEIVFGTYNNTTPTNSKKENIKKVDITNYSEVEAWINSLHGLEKITLINCAGITYNSFTHKSEVEKWKNVIEVNLLGNYYAIRAVLPIMREENFGRIINISSVTAQKGTPGISAYAASKSALWGLTKTIAVENGKKGITINNINLGYSELGMINEVPPKFQEKIKELIPSGEFCSKEDLFKSVEFIKNNGYLNGSSIDLNGGLF